MSEEQILKIRAKMPNFCAIGGKNGNPEILLYHISGQGKGEPSYRIPLSEMIDIIEYIKVFHPNYFKEAWENSHFKMTENFKKIAEGK
jgi:hypothetical protein